MELYLASLNLERLMVLMSKQTHFWGKWHPFHKASPIMPKEIQQLIKESSIMGCIVIFSQEGLHLKPVFYAIDLRENKVCCILAFIFHQPSEPTLVSHFFSKIGTSYLWADNFGYFSLSNLHSFCFDSSPTAVCCLNWTVADWCTEVHSKIYCMFTNYWPHSMQDYIVVELKLYNIFDWLMVPLYFCKLKFSKCYNWLAVQNLRFKFYFCFHNS
jgi:hypothetical protein